MSTLLVLTVGGSCSPVIAAIQEYAPDFVGFIVSTGSRGSIKTIQAEGDPCGDKRKATCPKCGESYMLGNPKGANIVTQAQLNEEQYGIFELSDPDAFATSYSEIVQFLVELQSNNQGWRLIADYTGGTKTMSAALAAAALELDWELSLVRGARMDLTKVRNGTEIAALVNASEVRAKRTISEARRLFSDYAYASAGTVLRSALHSAPLSLGLRTEIQAWVTICRGFDAWDHFDTVRAHTLLDSYQRYIVSQWIFLKKLASAEPGYALVLDLVRNAERRAARERYDDAVARLYRALELLAQTRMTAREPALDSSDLNVADLPKSLRGYYENLREDDKIKLGLLQDYELLKKLEDPLGKHYAENKSKLLDALRYRNNSIFAHGLEPVTETMWQKMTGDVIDFIEEGVRLFDNRMRAPQFPRAEEIQM